MVLFTLDNGRMVPDMAEESKSGVTVPNMKDTGETTKPTARED